MDSSDSQELQENDKLENAQNQESQFQLMNEDTLLAKRKDSDLQDIHDDLECKDDREEFCQISEYAKIEILGRRKENPLLQGCNSIENYLYLNKIHEGAYGVVFRARDKISNKQYAIKSIKIFRNTSGFPEVFLREINFLLGIDHANIIKMKEVVVGNSLDKVYIVMEYMENELKELLEQMEHGFTVSQLKCLVKQLLEAVNH